MIEYFVHVQGRGETCGRRSMPTQVPYQSMPVGEARKDSGRLHPENQSPAQRGRVRQVVEKYGRGFLEVCKRTATWGIRRVGVTVGYQRGRAQKVKHPVGGRRPECFSCVSTQRWVSKSVVLRRAKRRTCRRTPRCPCDSQQRPRPKHDPLPLL